jgi:hypothetical protein
MKWTAATAKEKRKEREGGELKISNGESNGLWWPGGVPAVGAENLRDQAIFVNHAPGAIAPLDPELIEIRDAVGQLP